MLLMTNEDRYELAYPVRRSKAVFEVEGGKSKWGRNHPLTLSRLWALAPQVEQKNEPVKLLKINCVITEFDKTNPTNYRK